jgi:uncharacterized membrane protein
MQTFMYFGIFASLAWGVQVFLLKLATTRENRNNDPAKVFILLATGIYITFLVGFLTTNGFKALGQFSFSSFWISVGAGSMWGLGTICVILALFDPQTSISKIVPLYNTNTLIVVLSGVVFLHESIQNPLMLILGTVFVVLGSVIITWKDSDKSTADKVASKKPQQWIAYGLIASFSWSGYAILSKIVAAAKSPVNDPFLTSVEQSLGILVVATIVLILRRKKLGPLTKSGLVFSASSGVLWGLGSIGLLIAINRYAASISNLVPIYNTNTLVAVILGMVVLHEVPARRFYVLLGALAIVVGGILVVMN